MLWGDVLDEHYHTELTFQVVECGYSKPDTFVGFFIGSGRGLHLHQQLGTRDLVVLDNTNTEIDPVVIGWLPARPLTREALLEKTL